MGPHLQFTQLELGLTRQLESILPDEVGGSIPPQAARYVPKCEIHSKVASTCRRLVWIELKPLYISQIKYE